MSQSSAFRGSGNSFPRVTRKSKVPFGYWFYNLPVRQKQLLGLFTSEAISILGLVGASSLLIIFGGRAQLLNQAKSELAVSKIQYNVKVDQMGYGFRGQSDNLAIIDAAKAHAAGQPLSTSTAEAVKQILQNEVSARNIEYATLVGQDLRIIANANANRTGERFDPEGLVGTMMAHPRQIKASAIVSWAELEKEAPTLPEGFSNQNALMRYTVTPVKDPNTDGVIGALISGDIVNQKPEIAEGVLDAFQNGYSAIYAYQPNGEYTLTTALDLGDRADIGQAVPNRRLANETILDRAVSKGSGAVTQRLTVGDQTYTVAAEAISNFKDEPVAILVRGTSEANLNQLIFNSLKLQFLIASLALAADVVLAGLLGRSIVKPLRMLQEASRQFRMGDRRARSDIFAKDEVGQVAHAFNQLADSIVSSEAALRQQSVYQSISAERARLLTALTIRIRQSLNPEEILNTTVEGIREVLQVDRVVIYRFYPDFQGGVITAESIAPGWMRALGSDIEDPLRPEAIERFRSGRISTIENLNQANLTHCHCEILKRLEVQANMVAPILVGEELMGLLCAHQCSGPREWEEGEIDLIQQVSTQVGYALSQANLMQQQRATADRERRLNQIVSQLRDALDPDQIFSAVVRESRQVLAADRVIVYLFDQHWQGTVVAESVGSGWPAALGAQIDDPCFANRFVEKYQQGRVQATENIYDAGLTECHLKQLEPLSVQANLVAPILKDGKLLGLLIAHQCSAPRAWSGLDITFLKQVSTQLGFALEQASLFAQLEQSRLEAEDLSEERRRQQEMLQMQLVELLGDVEGASQGDLTVRADVTAGEIGTVADFFNSIIESLRQIVTKVKQSASQVNTSLENNEGEIRRLADNALKQSRETTQTLDSVEQMTDSIQQVAASARQAAVVARSASETAEVGGSAMDLTVQNILGLRETVAETAKKVKRLGESSQQISKVVSLINQIAMQTNLLAINAGIEAARAGEEGQGFAVVAEEVGELAARSSVATQEIERIVDTIQRETGEVVDAMEQSTMQVVEGTHRVEDAKQSLTKILEVSYQIDQLVQSISEMTVSQVQTSEGVSRLMKQIAQVSEETSHSSRQVSGALRETVEIAQELQASVGAFKVGDSM